MIFVFICTIVFYTLKPSEKGAVIVIFNPDTVIKSIVQASINADGYLMDTLSLPGAYILWSDTPGFPARLKQQGALLVINYQGVAGCTSKRPLINQPFKKQSEQIS